MSRRKLDNAQKERITKLYDNGKGLTQDVLAERFGVTQPLIYDIVKRGKQNESILDRSLPHSAR